MLGRVVSRGRLWSVGSGDVLDKEDLGGKVEAEAQRVRDVVVPMQIFVVDFC